MEREDLRTRAPLAGSLATRLQTGKWKRTRLSRWLALLGAVGAMWTTTTSSTRSLGATTTTTPFYGITLHQRTETSPRDLRINVAVIDLNTPGIGFAVTEANGDLPEETTRQRTRDYLAQEGAQLAVNASFFSVNTDAYANNSGLAASNGDVYSPMSDYDAVNISASNAVTFLRSTSPGGIFTPSPNIPLYNAVAGNQRLLRNGVNLSSEPTGALAARTGIGLTQDGDTLILMTIDNAGPSDGVTRPELTSFLLEYGAYNALNLDGGGSTTMAIADPVARVLNTPSDNPARAVGTNLAVFAQPFPEPGGIAVIAFGLIGLAARRRPRLSGTPRRPGSAVAREA